jgi:tRNA(fMet)-specific endonuclease VapC
VTYLLDTNICIYIIKRRPEAVFERFRGLSVGEVGISAITYSELCYGVEKSGNPERNAAALSQFTAPLEVLPYPEEAGMAYGTIRARLETEGQQIGPLDTLIAAHAWLLGCILVSNNLGEFSRIGDLKVENWV